MGEQEKFNVIIAGGRDFQNYNLLCEKCDFYFSRIKPTAIISGLAKGADSLGRQYGLNRGIQVLEFPADWNKYGKSAGMRRNQEMLKIADGLIAFWDGKSRGTENMINIAKNKGIPIRIVHY